MHTAFCDAGVCIAGALADDVRDQVGAQVNAAGMARLLAGDASLGLFALLSALLQRFGHPDQGAGPPNGLPSSGIGLSTSIACHSYCHA